MNNAFDPAMIALRVPPILAALTFHEFSHAWVADRLGDPTPREMGRLSLNPIHHLDPLGTMMLFFGPFGWARPVPVNPYYLRNPRRDMFWIASAGPLSNILQGLVILAVMAIWQHTLPMDGTWGTLYQMLSIGYLINVVLAAFNMIPLAPLDGSKVLMGIVSQRTAIRLIDFERYGPVILLGLFALGWFGLPILNLLMAPAFIVASMLQQLVLG